MWHLLLPGLLYPTVGLALFVGWGYANLWEQRGHPHRATLTRFAVAITACAPLLWSFWRIYGDLGLGALPYSCYLTVCAVGLYLLAFRLRGYLDRSSARGRCQSVPH